MDTSKPSRPVKNQHGIVSRIERNCLTCGALIFVKPSVIAKGGGKYCRHACWAKSISTHGETKSRVRSPEYMAWVAIKMRCLNPADKHYPNYGGRGITLCAEWNESYEVFLEHIGRRPSAKHSIDRIDNEGNYAPGNVRWSTIREQNQNRRSNKLITFNGETHCISEWARILGLHPDTIAHRLRRGWDIASVLTPQICKTR